MRRFKTDIYTASTGVQMTLLWANEHDYQLGIEFLTKLGTACGQSEEDRPRRPPFFYLQDDTQLEALMSFRKSLEAR